jgi:hypothetical protein
MRKAYYTASVGAYDSIREPANVNPEYDYICFTDIDPHLIPPPWKNTPVGRVDEIPVRFAKKFKQQPHIYMPNYDLVIWVDANAIITSSPDDIIQEYIIDKNYDIIAFKHPERVCSYHEASEIVRLNIDDPSIVYPQMNRYKKEGFPINFGLFEGNAIISRPNNPKSIEFFNFWYEETKSGSKRDQLSNMYSIWKTNVKAKIMDETSRTGKYFILTPHKY